MENENTKEILRGIMRVAECNYADEKLCKRPKVFCKNVEDKYYELKTRTAEVEEGLKSAIYALEKIGTDEPDLWSKRVKGHMTIDSLLSELHCLINSDR